MAKILLVEDDKSLREIYDVRLKAEGYQIVSAGDGEEALAMAIKERPDLIVSDVMMPKISGFDMLDILRSTTETKDVKVIMMTALSSEDQRARGEALGADRYLVKSQVGIEDVVRTVHDVLGDNVQAAPAAPSFGPAAGVPVPAAAPLSEPPVITIPPIPEPIVAAPAAPAPVAPAPVAQVSEPTPAPLPVPTPVFEAAPQPIAPATAPVFEQPVAPAPEPPVLAAPAPLPVPSTPAPAPAPTVDPVYSAPPAPAPVFEQPAPVAPAAMFVPETPAPVFAAPEPAPAAPAPAPAPVTPVPVAIAPEPALPQPTAPFSTPAPASLGERIIEPLRAEVDPNAAPTLDIASQMDQALNANPQSIFPNQNNTPQQ